MTSVQSSKVYSLRVTLGAGAYQSAVANFNGSSRILSLERITVGAGVVGNPVAFGAQPTGAGAGAQWQLTVYSSANTDVGTYQVNWVNDYIPSQLLTQGGALADAQFSP